MIAIGKQAWFALMNRKTRTARPRSPVANQAAARERMSRSSRNCLFSRRSRASSSRSAALSHQPAPPVGPPALSACATQMPIDCAVGSNSRASSSGRAQHGPDQPSGGGTPVNKDGRVLGMSTASVRVSLRGASIQTRLFRTLRGSCRHQNAPSQQVEAGAAIALPLQQLEAVDLAFSLPAAPGWVRAARIAAPSPSSPAANVAIAEAPHARASASQASSSTPGSAGGRPSSPAGNAAGAYRAVKRRAS